MGCLAGRPSVVANPNCGTVPGPSKAGIPYRMHRNHTQWCRCCSFGPSHDHRRKHIREQAAASSPAATWANSITCGRTSPSPLVLDQQYVATESRVVSLKKVTLSKLWKPDCHSLLHRSIGNSAQLGRPAKPNGVLRVDPVESPRHFAGFDCSWLASLVPGPEVQAGNRLA
jgi:hypothetical protein